MQKALTMAPGTTQCSLSAAFCAPDVNRVKRLGQHPIPERSRRRLSGLTGVGDTQNWASQGYNLRKWAA